MRITEVKGYELEKAQSNTSEDFFNRSEVTFEEDGKEKTFHVLYIRYFDKTFPELLEIGGENDPIFQIGDREVSFKDIIALTCLIKNPGFRQRKRLYINTQEELSRYFEGVDVPKFREIFEGLENKGEYILSSPLEFLAQASHNKNNRNVSL
ncbi:hypothetical protein [Sutcliffiella deserti]|uniref:hypothetical protein n=1 Tax=Sutcliffiella deserti TaxID=2875501 RepID=UPI001CC011FB|nr:hypothetical protein [Sutcliffiella deserti]